MRDDPAGADPAGLLDAGPAIAVAFPVPDARLRPPLRPAGLVERARLVDLLDAEPRAPVIAVVAPPGYGKTTLLAQWVERRPEPVAWLTLGALDNDPAVLVGHLAAALDRVHPVDASTRSAIATSSRRILASAVPLLASVLHGWGHPAVLVLDDAHQLVDRQALDAVAALLEHAPRGFRVAIAGRHEPDLPLARLRAQRALVEVGPRALALDDREAAELAALAGWTPSAEEVSSLVAGTEGWAAGIYLAVLARRRSRAVATEPIVSGGDGYIAAYLASEFADGLSDDDVTLLTRSSILEVMVPAAVEAVSGMAGASARLAALARENLLIERIEEPASAFRYHNLLRDFLAEELERREGAAVPGLHRRASAWYLAAGDTDRAVHHALAGGDVETAVRLVTAAALPTFQAGDVAIVQRWLRAFDDDVRAGHPSLAVLTGWMALLDGQPDVGDRMLDMAEAAVPSSEAGDGSASFESQRAMLRAVMGRHGPADVLANAELAVAAERPSSPWRANALWLRGAALAMLGDPDGADASLEEAAAGRRAGGTAMVAIAKRAGLAMARGDWGAAEDHARAARALLIRSHYQELAQALLVLAVSARVAIHRGDVTRARDELVRAQLVRPIASRGLPWYSVDALLELARAYLAISDLAGAQSVLREAEAIVRVRPHLGTLTGDLLAVRRRLSGATAALAGSSSLTAAELQVLPLLSTYLSFQGIADRLFVSRNTVKTHAMAIYGKLQASSRAEAVERAVELGLLEPFPGLELAGRPRPDR